MSVQSEIDRIKSNVAGAYSAVADMGGTLPAEQTSNNLAAAVGTIPARGLPPGGATGQVPVKASDEDYDVTWADGVTLEQVNEAIRAAVLASWEGSY